MHPTSSGSTTRSAAPAPSRPWIDHPYGEEEITLLEEELLPAMALFLAREED